jgi:hypothetical protein
MFCNIARRRETSCPAASVSSHRINILPFRIHARSIPEMASLKKAAEKATVAAVGKRKTSSSLQVNGLKKLKVTPSANDPLRQPHDRAQEAEDNGIVIRKFYPPEMNNARALAYNADQLPRPIELLNAALKNEPR